MTDSELIKRINPMAFAQYLGTNGWSQFRTKRTDIRVFQKDCEKFIQVTIPMDNNLADYDIALYEACKKVAECEGRTPEQFCLRLLDFDSDVNKNKKRMISMKLNDTVSLMNSDDYKERFKAEYYQLVIRYRKLCTMLSEWDNEKLDFVPACNRGIYNFQVRAMADYIACLETRAMIENIEL